ncbi:MAG: DNA repair protein RecO [Clostridiales Family XIII bacterium]|jgi:DNA repair protein RecO (recombination protein O)|nr:DNA repair protein RecO [Clostridiales Family XIII bacterium]
MRAADSGKRKTGGADMICGECEGIVIRQTKALKGRRLLLLFSDAYGKIGAGTSISERSKSKSALAVRPFTRGRYQLASGRGYVNITSAETIQSYYNFGENYGKFLNASLLLEFTGKFLPEEVPAPDVYALLLTCLDLLGKRKRGFDTISLVYLVKVLQLSGVFPEAENFRHDELLSGLGFDIVNILVYLMENPPERMERLMLDEDKSARLLRLIIQYAEQHLDVGPLKSVAYDH